jgi:hypothetical protein
LRAAAERVIVGQTVWMAMAKMMSGWMAGLVATVVVGAAAAGEPAREGRAGTPPTEDARAIKTISKFCDGLVPMTKINDRRLLLGLLEKSQSDRGRWTEYNQQAKLDAAAEAGHVYDVAQVWSRQDGAIAVSMSLSSGSGDWIQYVEYCFRPDGTLARTHATLNTFNAVSKDEFKDVNGASRQRDRYFDGSGRQVKVTKRLLDLKTKLPDPTLQFMESDEPIYKTATALPFFDLLKRGSLPNTPLQTDGASPRR